jgi:bacillithiol biosynthesis cysteine-adding enzyme BshC
MENSCTYIPYKDTGYFSKIVIDYLDNAETLKPFYQHYPNIEGIKNAIAARKNFNTDRITLVEALKNQYSNIQLNQIQETNLDLLLNENTFTITTAHQPNIFTGPLYFIYKIVHAIKLADELKLQLPEYNFVPIYYMGSEDADLEELGQITLDGKKLSWKTNQSGAVGRMVVDDNLVKLIDEIRGQIAVNEYGTRLCELFKRIYSPYKTIQTATLELVNELFSKYGLIVLIPDDRVLKSLFTPIIKKEIKEQFSNKILQNTIFDLNKNYKVQAKGREINLFYLKDNHRERIEIQEDTFFIKSLNLSFTLNEVFKEIEEYPERFSPNVILRGAFQELILPNIAFIGGGGELAYWLELKNILNSVDIPYPVLVLRNSFLLIDNKSKLLINKLNFNVTDIFKFKNDLFNHFVKIHSVNQISLTQPIKNIKAEFEQIKSIASKLDISLADHVASLEQKFYNNTVEIEKKLLKAEKRKFREQQNQIEKLKTNLFPNENLQERIENFAVLYSTMGNTLIHKLYTNSNGLDQLFTIIK